MDSQREGATHRGELCPALGNLVGSGAGRGGAGGSIRTEGYVYTVYSGCMAETNTTLQSIYPPVKS